MTHADAQQLAAQLRTEERVADTDVRKSYPQRATDPLARADDYVVAFELRSPDASRSQWWLVSSAAGAQQLLDAG